MTYQNTFIKVAEDCPVSKSEVPVVKGDRKPAHLVAYEVLTKHPCRYGHDELIFEQFIQKLTIPPDVLKNQKGKIRAELFSKGYPCMRASALTKRYGFGANYNAERKIAIYSMESDECKTSIEDPCVEKLPAMKSKR